VRIAEEQMALVREAVGDDVEIVFDVHTRLDIALAVTLCRSLEKYRPYFVEDPLRSENPGSYRTLARHVSVPIAAGEQWSSKWGFREVIEEEFISYARVDLCIAGGLTEALKIAHWCETHYIDLAPHNPSDPSPQPPARLSTWFQQMSVYSKCPADQAASPRTSSQSR
jgi:galactonate dehydratase